MLAPAALPPAAVLSMRDPISQAVSMVNHNLHKHRE